MNENRDNNHLRPNELLQRAQDYHYRESLPREEFEALMEIGAELVNPGVYDAQCFVLGSYDTPEKQRLKHVKREINDWSQANCRAYLMEDLADDLHPVVQFRIIADYSDHIIGVCEHDQGGFQLELGMLIALTRYQDRAHLLKRTYPEDVEHERYNWMLDAGVFDLFRYDDQLSEWEDTSEFKVEVDDLLREIFD